MKIIDSEALRLLLYITATLCFLCILYIIQHSKKLRTIDTVYRYLLCEKCSHKILCKHHLEIVYGDDCTMRNGGKEG